MDPNADGPKFNLSRILAYLEQNAEARIKAHETRLAKSAGRQFTSFRKLPLELRLQIWKFTFRPRDIRLHLIINERAVQGPLLQCVIAADRDLVALSTYETFLTKISTARENYPNYELKLVGFPSMRINSDIDKVIISRGFGNVMFGLGPAHIPSVKNFIATEKVKHLGVDLNIHGTTAIEAPYLPRMLKDWPNLKKLQFIFGTGWTTRKGLTEALKMQVALPLVPFDSNLEDYLAYVRQKQGREKSQPVNDMTRLHNVFSNGQTIKRIFWDFMRDSVAPGQWSGLSFDTAFLAAWTTEASTFQEHISRTVQVPRLVIDCSLAIRSRLHLPPHMQDFFSAQKFPATMWRNWEIGGSDGVVRSRYDGLERLFAEMKMD